jgi:hypothetical protein
MHYVATVTGMAGAVVAIWFELLWLMAGGIGIGVTMAVTSHWWIEHNRPLIRVNPFYGALSDLRMCWLAVTGGLRSEYARLGLGLPAPKAALGGGLPANDPTAPFSRAA